MIGNSKAYLAVLWVVLALLTSSQGVAQQEEGGTVVHSTEGLFALLNPECADFKVVSSCSCTGTQVEQACDLVSYHVPKFLVETVLKPRDTLIGSSVLPANVGAIMPGLGTASPYFASGGAGNAQESGHTALFFREAHVYTFPDITTFGCRACADRSSPGSPVLLPNYFSELDLTPWRFVPEEAGSLLVLHLIRVGVWGNLFPRVGFSRHHELPVAAALAATRALDIVHHPAPDPGSMTPRRVISAVAGIPPVCFQVGYPKISRCAMAGMNPIHWDLERVELYGRNIFVYWERKVCCVDPEVAACGLAVSAANQDNFCDHVFDPITGIVPGMPLDVPFDNK